MLFAELPAEPPLQACHQSVLPLPGSQAVVWVGLEKALRRGQPPLYKPRVCAGERLEHLGINLSRVRKLLRRTPVTDVLVPLGRPLRHTLNPAVVINRRASVCRPRIPPALVRLQHNKE